MDIRDEGVTRVHLTSAAVTGPDRVDAFRETICRPLMNADIEPLGAVFEFDCTMHAVAGFVAAFGEMSPARCTRSATRIEDDDVILTGVVRGRMTVREGAGEAVLADGGAALVSNDETGVGLGHVKSRLCNLRFNRARLESMSVDIGSALGRLVLRDTPALRLLLSYAQIVEDSRALQTAELRRAVIEHMYDLAALSVGTSADAAHAAHRRGMRAARLRAIKADIRENLTDSALSVNSVAARHGVSPRYVQMVFETEGLTFSGYVLEQRLALARRMLGNPCAWTRNISAIAYEVGFRDLSYFNRAFRSHYGMTPSEARTAACSL
jgi:AraC-like DNA-binding protein